MSEKGRSHLPLSETRLTRAQRREQQRANDKLRKRQTRQDTGQVARKIIAAGAIIAGVGAAAEAGTKVSDIFISPPARTAEASLPNSLPQQVAEYYPQLQGDSLRQTGEISTNGAAIAVYNYSSLRLRMGALGKLYSLEEHINDIFSDQTGTTYQSQPRNPGTVTVIIAPEGAKNPASPVLASSSFTHISFTPTHRASTFISDEPYQYVTSIIKTYSRRDVREPADREATTTAQLTQEAVAAEGCQALVDVVSVSPQMKTLNVHMAQEAMCNSVSLAFMVSHTDSPPSYAGYQTITKKAIDTLSNGKSFRPFTFPSDFYAAIKRIPNLFTQRS